MDAEEHDMQIDIMHALRDFLDAYDDHSEMVVTEAIGNAIDVGATEMRVALKTDKSDDAVISFYNNGPGMNEKQFEDYHVVARSSKTKGRGIGFAGVGAKVYLAAWPEGTVIHTETSDGRTPLASNMYVRDGRLKYAYVNPALNKAGTLYEVKLKYLDYCKLANEIDGIIVDTFTPAMLNGLKISVNGKPIQPWKPRHEFKKSIKATAKGRHYGILLTVAEDDVPPAKQIFQYHVSGKVIMTKKPDWRDELKGRYKGRVHAFVDATKLSDFLNLSKTSFKSTQTADVAAMIKETYRRAYLALKKEGFIEAESIRKWEQTPLTRFFQKLFKNPEFAWLNPEPIGGSGGGQPGTGGGGGTSEPSNGGGKGQNGGSDEPKSTGGGTTKPGQGDPPRGRGAFSVTFASGLRSDRDGWLDEETNKVVINLDHPLFIKYENNMQARNQRIGSIITSVLLKNAVSKRAMDAKEAFDMHTRILTMAKDEMW